LTPHRVGTCNGSGIIRDRKPGDTGDVHDCPGCVACMWDDEDTPAAHPDHTAHCAARLAYGDGECECGATPTPTEAPK